MIYIISDTHFLHRNIIKYCNRPENHEELIINNWKKVVKDDDVIFHLGDIAASIRGRYNDLEEIFKELPGKKFLARGNHDHLEASWYKEHLGFEEVAEYYVLDDIFMSHYPIKTNEYSKQKEIEQIQRLREVIERNEIKHIIHGHVHNRDTGLEKHYNVSVESINYSPISLDDLLSQH